MVAKLKQRAFFECGQATVELAVVFPVLLLVALIVTNALLFLSDCAAFDRIARQAVRVYAASPAYAQDADESRLLIENRLQELFDRENLAVSVAVENVSGGKRAYTARLEYRPTLFCLGLRDEILGVSLPALSHHVRYVVDPYKPGVLI